MSRDAVVVYGPLAVPWDDLYEARSDGLTIGMCALYPTMVADRTYLLMEARSEFRAGKCPPLLVLMLRCRRFLATDAGDKIYALLSLADPHDVKRLGIHVDYSPENTSSVLFKSLAVASL